MRLGSRVQEKLKADEALVTTCGFALLVKIPFVHITHLMRDYRTRCDSSANLISPLVCSLYAWAAAGRTSLRIVNSFSSAPRVSTMPV